MKNLALIFVFCFLAICVFAQAPQSFNYQLVARDTSGKVLANRTLSIQISILNDSNTGIVVYSERHTTTTNNYGLVNLSIGTGSVVSGIFYPIEWGTHLHFIKLDIDPNGGDNYFTLGVSQLMSVPYALYAEKAGNVVDTSNTNELQALSISNDTIYLSNGGFVKLPSNVGVWSLDGNNTFNNNSGFVGIGTNEPTSALHVNGSVRITDDSEGAGKVLTSDPLGNASWQAPLTNTFSGDSNYVPKFNSNNNIGNSILYQKGKNLGIGTTSPVGRLVVQGDSLANDSLPLFEVKDKSGNTVFVVWPDGVHVYVNDTSASKAQNKGSFAVSGKSTAKGVTDDVFVVKPNDVNIYLNESGANKANNKGSFAVSGKSTAKSVNNNYMVVNHDSVRVYIDANSAGNENKGGFSVNGQGQNHGMPFLFSDKSGLNVSYLTTLERDSITNPRMSSMIFNTTDSCLQIYLGYWESIWCTPMNCVYPVIKTQPVNDSIWSGVNANFSITASGSKLYFKWQESKDNGITWIMLSDGGTSPNYLGTHSNSLSLNNVPSSFYMYKYRCLVTNACGDDLSLPANLIVGCNLAFQDNRDGQIYKTIKIGSQCWMAENLKATKYRDGTSIPNITDNYAWSNSSGLYSGAYCDYNNTPSNSDIYGRLYNNFVVHDTHNICPEGWHIPSETEWTQLSSYLGGNSIAGGKMKETNTTHWNSPNTGADNSSGFNGLPGGYRTHLGTFSEIGSSGEFWSFASGDLYYLYYNDAKLTWDYSYFFLWRGVSIRCIRD